MYEPVSVKGLTLSYSSLSSQGPPPQFLAHTDIHQWNDYSFQPTNVWLQTAIVSVTTHFRPSLQRITQPTTDHALSPYLP